MAAAGGNSPKPPVRAGTLPGVAPSAKPVAAKPAPTPAPAPVKPPDGINREELRGIASAIARAETATLRDDLVTRLNRIEERLTALEKKPATPPPLPVTPLVPAVAPVAAPAPVAVSIPVAVSAPPPALVTAPAPRVDFDLSHASLDDADLPFVSGARRRKRLAMIVVFLLLATVGTIVITAIVSQAINNHSM